MAHRALTEEQAYRQMRQTAMNQVRRLVDVAQSVLAPPSRCSREGRKSASKHLSHALIECVDFDCAPQQGVTRELATSPT